MSRRWCSSCSARGTPLATVDADRGPSRRFGGRRPDRNAPPPVECAEDMLRLSRAARAMAVKAALVSIGRRSSRTSGPLGRRLECLRGSRHRPRPVERNHEQARMFGHVNHSSAGQGAKHSPTGLCPANGARNARRRDHGAASARSLRRGHDPRVEPREVQRRPLPQPLPAARSSPTAQTSTPRDPARARRGCGDGCGLGPRSTWHRSRPAGVGFLPLPSRAPPGPKLGLLGRASAAPASSAIHLRACTPHMRTALPSRAAAARESSDWRTHPSQLLLPPRREEAGLLALHPNSLCVRTANACRAGHAFGTPPPPVSPPTRKREDAGASPGSPS
jgi:hypothetical protein